MSYNLEESLIYRFGFHPLTAIQSRKGRLNSNGYNRRLKTECAGPSVSVWEHQAVPYSSFSRYRTMNAFFEA